MDINKLSNYIKNSDVYTKLLDLNVKIINTTNIPIYVIKN